MDGVDGPAVQADLLEQTIQIKISSNIYVCSSNLLIHKKNLAGLRLAFVGKDVFTN
jgi:hypothetical protein